MDIMRQQAVGSAASLGHDIPSNDHDGREVLFQGTGKGLCSESREWEGLPILAGTEHLISFVEWKLGARFNLTIYVNNYNNIENKYNVYLCPTYPTLRWLFPLPEMLILSLSAWLCCITIFRYWLKYQSQ